MMYSVRVFMSPCSSVFGGSGSQWSGVRVGASIYCSKSCGRTRVQSCVIPQINKNKMKGEPLVKPPPLLLPSKGHPEQIRHGNKNSSRYDNYNGIIKRVYDMKLRMESDEKNTESENSSVRTRSSRSSGIPETLSCDEMCSPFEDISSSSSFTGSDQSPPYEEIPAGMKRLSYSSLPSPPSSATSLRSFRESLPPAPTPTPVYSNESARISRTNSTNSSEYVNSEVVLRRSTPRSSLYSNCEPEYINTQSPLYSNTAESVTTDVNENETKLDITDAERRRIEMFFRGLRTELWVSTSIADMYTRPNTSGSSWVHKYRGVPLILLESGDTKSRSKRRIEMILAEQGTCFPLWRDTIDNLSAYKNEGEAFHTMCLSTDHQQLVGFSFSSVEEANKILTTMETLTSDPKNINISVPGSKKKKDKSKVKKPFVLPQKTQISNPCLFEHVTTVASKDGSAYSSLKMLVDKSLRKKPENIA